MMSEYERNKGKLILVDYDGGDDDAAALLDNCVLPGWAECHKDLMGDEGYGFILIGKLYYRFEKEEIDDHDPEYCNVTKNEDGSFSFESYHYNGGAHWAELLEGKLN